MPVIFIKEERTAIMEISYMLNQMCHVALATADISAIRKARGFSQKETVSRSTFESFFLSSIGLETVMASLSPEEVATLHLLTLKNEEVDITFFERLYGSARRDQKYYYGTFTQQYKETFDAVKKSLVRKGILLIAEAKVRGESVQLERWRFRFPSEFAPFLPPIIQSPFVSTSSGEVQAEVARKKLLELAGGPEIVAGHARASYSLATKKGVLMFGADPFRAEALVQWQRAMWDAELSIAAASDLILPTAALQAILALLRPGEWVAPEQLEPLLRIFCFGEKLPGAESICQAGWKWGCLAQLVDRGKTFYRLHSPVVDSEPVDPAVYLRPAPQGESVLVDLRTIPFRDLEELNQLAHLEVTDRNLVASPDPVRLGRAGLDALQTPLARWLYENLIAFRQAVDSVREHWGKTILHSNLLVARARDLSLRVQLERELGEQILVLNDEYIAFPASWRAEVEKVLKKWGFVVKEVCA